MGTDDKIQKLRALLERVTTRAAEPRVRVTAAVAAEPELEAELEVVDEELVEDVEELELVGGEMVTEGFEEMEVGEDVSLEASLSELEEEEEAPESRPRPAASMGEAGADDYVREEPLKTPPPESGRQELTSPPPAAPEASGMNASAGLEADHSGAPLGRPGAEPTVEQLGEVVELEGGDAGAELELEPPPLPPTTPEVPRAQPAPAQTSPAPAPRAPAGGSPVARPAPPPSGPERFERPEPPAAAPATFERGRPTAAPATFVELLDASLAL